jgi:hypothetical protein
VPEVVGGGRSGGLVAADVGVGSGQHAEHVRQGPGRLS